MKRNIKKEEPREKSQAAKDKRQEVTDKITKEARGQRQEAREKRSGETQETGEYKKCEMRDAKTRGETRPKKI